MIRTIRKIFYTYEIKGKALLKVLLRTRDNPSPLGCAGPPPVGCRTPPRVCMEQEKKIDI